MAKKIEPKAISGFPEWLPEEKILEQRLLDIIRSNFERFGFSPIETSAVEKVETLVAKGVSSKEIYGLRRLAAEESDDSKDLALHFDLTVPMARYVAQNYHKLIFPFRRYQIQKVWRGERSQSGRYREFYQCDIDIIGDNELNFLADAEIPSVIYRIFKEMNIGRFVIRISNRKILQGYLESINISKDRMMLVMRIVDKLEKIGKQRVLSELINSAEILKRTAEQLLYFISLSEENNEIIFKKMRDMKINSLFERGVYELETVIKQLSSLGVPDDYFKVDIGIVRGLDYYTGTIYETVLVDYPGIGSICSGGRFDDLASYFIDKKLPGVGISIGLTRLFSRLTDAEILKVGPATTAPVLIASLDETQMIKYFEIATLLRDNGINTEVYTESAKIGDQLKFANKKGFTFVVIAGSDELAENSVQLKNLLTGEQHIVKISGLVNEIKNSLK
ncbi:histidine--tRNA ligase [Candidatus Wolfebacteria bacterium]|nr:histidine--tRNA ligase [Candidatus Wolfebacteria bacterium]